VWCLPLPPQELVISCSEFLLLDFIMSQFPVVMFVLLQGTPLWPVLWSLWGSGCHVSEKESISGLSIGSKHPIVHAKWDQSILFSNVGLHHGNRILPSKVKVSYCVCQVVDQRYSGHFGGDGLHGCSRVPATSWQAVVLRRHLSNSIKSMN
jgi:hypothetical protein